MKVIFLVDKIGSNDGIKTILFKKGEVYEIDKDIKSSLYIPWIKKNICEYFDEIEEEEIEEEEETEVSNENEIQQKKRGRKPKNKI